jgi:spore coat polysaccharide biosynthesis predicted glycosyltransferase SpsG
MLSSAKSLTDFSESREQPEKACLWVRTAAGPQIGFGHLKRSVILAQSLMDCCYPMFLVDSQDCWSQERLANLGFRYFTEDLGRTWSVLPKPVAILIDTRIPTGLDHLIESANARKIPVVSIHDLGLNPFPSNILIDGSISPDYLKSQRNATFYCGTPYMVLDPEYRLLHQKKKQIQKKIGSVFINLGGGDSRRYFLKVLEGLKEWDHPLNVVGTPGFARWGQEDLERENWGRVAFRWETGPINRFLFEADLAITAGGLAAYEALCAGTPLMALSYDAYQQSAILALSNEGACICLGLGDDLEPSRLCDKLTAIEHNFMERNRLSSKGRQIVDGLGAQRVSQIIRDLIFKSLLEDFEAI